MEQLAVTAAIGVSGFMLWRAWRDGQANTSSSMQKTRGQILGFLNDVDTLKKQQALSGLVPKADDFINSIYGGGSGSSGGSGGYSVTNPPSQGVVLSNGKVYGQGMDPGYSNLY
jgi:hypothetical protein